MRAAPKGRKSTKSEKCINLHVLPRGTPGRGAQAAALGRDSPRGSPAAPASARGTDTAFVLPLGDLGGTAGGPWAWRGGQAPGTSTLGQSTPFAPLSAPRKTKRSPHTERGMGTLSCSNGGSHSPSPVPCGDNVTSLGEAPRQGHTGSPGRELGDTRAPPGGGAELAPLQGTGGEISDGFSPGGLKLVCAPRAPGLWGGRECRCGAGGAQPRSRPAAFPAPARHQRGRRGWGAPL